MTRIYIAGKITDCPDYMERFASAEEMLSSCGKFEVVNPARVCAELPEETEYKDFIHIGLSLLDTCEAIYLLSNWYNSKGARLERQYAETLGYSIFEEWQENGQRVYQYEPAACDPWTEVEFV